MKGNGAIGRAFCWLRRFVRAAQVHATELAGCSLSDARWRVVRSCLLWLACLVGVRYADAVWQKAAAFMLPAYYVANASKASVRGKHDR